MATKTKKKGEDPVGPAVPPHMHAMKRMLSIIEANRAPLPPTRSVAIVDGRKVDAVTGVAMKDTNRLSSEADINTIEEIIHQANKQGIDPYTALAISMQETGLGTSGAKLYNPFHLLFSDNGPDEETRKLFNEDSAVSAGVNFLKTKFDLAKKLGKTDEAEIIQAYNGYGKVGANTEGVGQKSFYGVDVTKGPIDMSKNPVYGKRVIDVRDNIIKTNPEIVKLVQDYGKEDTSAYFPGKSMQAPQKKEEGGLVNSTAMDPQKWFTLTDAEKTAYMNSLPADQREPFMQSIDAYEQQQNATAGGITPPVRPQAPLAAAIGSSFARPRDNSAVAADIAAIQPGALPEEEIDPKVAANERAKKAISNAGDRLSSLAGVAGTFIDAANMANPENATPGMGALGKGLTGAAEGFAAGGPLGALIGGAVGAVGGALSAGTQREGYEQQEQLRKQRLLTGLRVAPSIQEEGGMVEVESEIEIPVQEEEGEVMLLPDGRLVDSMATKTHKEMNKGKGRDKNPVTDIIPSGTMVLSNSKKRLINLAKIKDDIFTVTRGHYSEDGNTPGETIYMGDIFGEKGKVTPAFLAKKIRKMHPIIDEPVEQYEIDTNRENMERRAQLLRPIMQMQEKVYKKFEYEKPEKFEKGGMVNKRRKIAIKGYEVGTDECGVGFFKDATGNCIPVMTPEQFASNGNKSQTDAFIAQMPTYEEREAFMDQVYQIGIKANEDMGVSLPGTTTTPPPAATPPAASVTPAVTPAVAAPVAAVANPSDPATFLKLPEAERDAYIATLSLQDRGTFWGRVQEYAANRDNYKTTPTAGVTTPPAAGGDVSINRPPEISEEAIAAGDKLLNDQKLQVEDSYAVNSANANNLYKSQRFRNMAIFASRIAGDKLQNPNVTPESLGTEHVDSMFPMVTESQIESQITPFRQSQNRAISQINDSGISGTRVGSALASTQARLLDAEGDIRNKALTVNQSQKAKRFGELQKILDGNRNAVVGAENATRTNRNNITSHIGEIGADALKAAGGLKEALSERMEELNKWRTEGKNTISQSQYEALQKREQTRIERIWLEKQFAGIEKVLSAMVKAG